MKELMEENEKRQALIESLQSENETLQKDLNEANNSLSEKEQTIQKQDESLRKKDEDLEKLKQESVSPWKYERVKQELSNLQKENEIYSGKISEARTSKIDYEEKLKVIRLTYRSINPGLLFFALAQLVMAVLNNPRFMKDVAAFFIGAGGAVRDWCEVTVFGARTVQTLLGMIPVENLNTVLKWIFSVIAFIGLATAPVILVGTGIWFVVRVYRKPLRDWISLAFASISFAAIIWFAKGIRKILPVNLLLLYLILQAGFIIVRMVIRKKRH
ncbi:MAG: hypothetical protein J5825_03320 [Lachnospiraceae bacterium]|nr:hypothetical protein [Lachnospiraceae bacterium]